MNTMTTLDNDVSYAGHGADCMCDECMEIIFRAVDTMDFDLLRRLMPIPEKNEREAGK